MTIVSETPKLSIVGLDRRGDDRQARGRDAAAARSIISIVVSNGGWYDREFTDKWFLHTHLRHLAATS